MKQPSAPFRRRATRLSAGVALALSAGIALAQQAPVRNATSPRAAGVGFSGATPPASATAPNARNPVAALPGTGTAASPLGAPSPSGLASPSPFPAGIPSTTIAAPGTTAAITGPTTVSPSLAGTGTTGGVPSSTRGVVNVPGATAPTVQPLDAGAVGPAGSAAAVLDPTGASAAGNAGSAISVGTPGGPATAITTTPGTNGTGTSNVIGGAGSLTGGVPSVSPQGVVAGGPLTALQVAQFFLRADANGDSLLSRAEALRLPVVTMSFEDMDTNRDGWVSRSEYDDSLR